MPPVFPPILARVRPSKQWVLPTKLDEPRARAAALLQATHGLTRPSDAPARVRLTGATAFWVPFWRVAVEVDGWVVDRSTKGNETSTRLDGGSRREVFVVCARRGFGQPEKDRARASLRQTLQDLPANAFVPRTDDDPWLATATCVDADVDAPEVESVVHKLAKNRLNSNDTVFSMTKSTVQTTDFLWQLVWWVDFLYSGEAHPGGEGEFFVALAGHDDAVLEEAHPSALRAVTARVRKVLSFDMSGFAGMRKRP